MNLEMSENELIIRESPGCLWIFGLLFAFVGGVFVYGALGGFLDYGRQEWWMLVLAFLMGSLGLATGAWIIHGAPMTKVVIDRLEMEVLIARRGLFGKSSSLFAFDVIDEFCLIEERDSEGEPVWFLGMKLIDGEIMKISSLASHDERFKRGFAFDANAFLGKQISSSAMILDAEDEDEPEMS